MPQGLSFDELHVVSDLHLGGAEGFQIFDAGAELAWLADQVAHSPVEGLAALVINGDFIDFLAEAPALAFDPDGATAKIDRVMGDAAFRPVFAAFKRLLANPRRRLVINLGNHDLELALPWVRRHLAGRLADDDAARSRLLMVTDGTGFACQVGPARVVCLHGNEVDSWNVTDFERLRRVGRDRQCGQGAQAWTPNAGAQLVVEVMNQVKRDYPFVDLLKPETEAVLPILAALNPQLLRRLDELTGIARRKAADAVRMRAGFLSADDAAHVGAATTGLPSPAADPWAPAAPGVQQSRAQDLLARAEQAWQTNPDPMAQLQGQAGEQLGVFSATWSWLTGKSRAEVLRKALDFLDKDQSFDLFARDDTFLGIDALVAPEVDIVITGHTHLARSLKRLRGFGHYFNSGSWATLMQISPAVRQDADRFARLFKLLDGSKVPALRAAEPDLVRNRHTAVRVWRDGSSLARAELLLVKADAAGIRAEPLAGTACEVVGTASPIPGSTPAKAAADAPGPSAALPLATQA